MYGNLCSYGVKSEPRSVHHAHQLEHHEEAHDEREREETREALTFWVPEVIRFGCYKIGGAKPLLSYVSFWFARGVEVLPRPNRFVRLGTSPKFLGMLRVLRFSPTNTIFVKAKRWHKEYLKLPAFWPNGFFALCFSPSAMYVVVVWAMYVAMYVV